MAKESRVQLPSLSIEQEVFLDQSVRVVEAGPGSGKTRALVARFLVSAGFGTKGVALLSFTNAAVNEVRSRTGAAPFLLRSPNFVGTIDSFLHRFIVTPHETSRLKKSPNYRASWDELPGDTGIRLARLPGVGIRLSRFRIDPNALARLNEADLNWQERAYLKEISDAGRLGELLSAAAARINGLADHGNYDASTARVVAHRILSSVEGRDILARLATRFGEVLVDEAQDCDEAEMAIIRSLAEHGICTLVVADPDQAIFEFRGSVPSLFTDYRDEQGMACCKQLATNYRSTREICLAVSALRCACTTDIVAADQASSCPVYVLSGSSAEQKEKFLTILEEQSVGVEEAIVLAHARADALAIAGGVARTTTSAAWGNVLIGACTVLRTKDASASERLAAIENVEKMILALLNWPADLQVASTTSRLAKIDRTQEWLRQVAAAVVRDVGSAGNATEFAAKARVTVERVLKSLTLNPLPLSTRLKKPNDDAWESYAKAHDSDATVLAHEAVHASKGMEYEAVLLAMPSALRTVNGKNVLENWADGENSEPRRVLYVGISRARRVLAFGAGPHAQRVEELLRNATVTVEVR